MVKTYNVHQNLFHYSRTYWDSALKFCIHPIVLFISIFISASSIFPLSPLQGKNIALIRDAEIENTIRSFSKPLLLAAGLDPVSIRIHILKDNTLNAFVAGGQQIFINSGLILQSDNASQIIGVLAHEIGHISGGHLIKGARARKDISTTNHKQPGRS